MTPGLDTALAECDELVVSLYIRDGKLSFRAGSLGFPDSLRDTLRAHRNELAAYLAEHSRPQPDWLPFVARNLDVQWFEFPLVATVAGLLVNQRPYYRLTPSIWVRFARALELQHGLNSGDPIASGGMLPAVDLLAALAGWINHHYRPDQIRRAFANPQPLPLLTGPGAEREESTQSPTEYQSPRCPLSQRPSECDPAPRGPTADRPHTPAATVATGSDCVPWC